MINDLKKEYAAMPADVRNGEAGQALLKEIQKRQRPKKVSVAGGVLADIMSGKAKGKVLRVLDNGEVSTIDTEAVKQLHASRQINIAELKRQLKPMPQEVRKVGANRNQPCPCGSGRKFKKCCFFKDAPIHITP